MFKFHYGAKKKSPKRIYIVGIVLALLADLLHSLLKVEKQTLWDLIDDIGRTFKIEDINDVILSNSKFLDRRIERDVDVALKDLKEQVKWEQVEISKPTFTETLEGETPLGGEMRSTYTFMDKENE
jgi:hypothetical protein